MTADDIASRKTKKHTGTCIIPHHPSSCLADFAKSHCHEEYPSTNKVFVEERNTSGPRLKVLSQNMAASFHKTSEIIGPHKGGIWNYMQRQSKTPAPPGTYKILNYILHIFSGWQRCFFFFSPSTVSPFSKLFDDKTIGMNCPSLLGLNLRLFLSFPHFPRQLVSLSKRVRRIMPDKSEGWHTSKWDSLDL